MDRGSSDANHHVDHRRYRGRCIRLPQHSPSGTQTIRVQRIAAVGRSATKSRCVAGHGQTNSRTSAHTVGPKRGGPREPQTGNLGRGTSAHHKRIGTQPYTYKALMNAYGTLSAEPRMRLPEGQMHGARRYQWGGWVSDQIKDMKIAFEHADQELRKTHNQLLKRSWLNRIKDSS